MTSTPLVGGTFFGLDISQLPQRLFNVRRRFSKRVLLLEFGSDALRYAEAKVSVDGVQLNHLSTFKLPADALDRGVPSDPVAMAELLKQICLEKKIPSHRVAVCLSPEVAFQRVIQLPADLTVEQARLYVLDPANGIQIPFPLLQTDFDLCSFSFGSEVSESQGMRDYLLSAIPQVLVDQVIAMLELANQELQLLELGCFSHLRLVRDDLLAIAEDHVHLVLELLPDCSYFMVVGNSGPMAVDRFAAIRTFPEPEFDEEQTLSVLQNHVNAESLIAQDENYLPISELDLRALIVDLKTSLKHFNDRFPNRVISCLHLMGSNTAHPNMAELLMSELGLNSVVCKPLLAPGLLATQADDPFLQGSLNRLVGLALGLLPKKMLLATSMHSVPETFDAKLNSGSALPVADVVGGEAAQSSSQLMQAALPSELSITTPQLVERQPVESNPDNGRNIGPFSADEADQTVDSEPKLLLLDDSSQDVASIHLTDNEQPVDVDASPEPLITRSTVVAEQESLESQRVDEQVERRQTINAVEDPSQWPSIQKAELEDDRELDENVAVAEADRLDQDVAIALDDGLEWPSIQKNRVDDLSDIASAPTSSPGDQLGEVDLPLEDASVWPSIQKTDLSEENDNHDNLAASKEDELDQDIAIASDDTSHWPSIHNEADGLVAGLMSDLKPVVSDHDVQIESPLEDSASWPSIQKVDPEQDSDAGASDRLSTLDDVDVAPTSSLDDELHGSVIQNTGDDAMHKLGNHPDAVVVSEDVDHDLLLILNDVVQEEIGALEESLHSSQASSETSLDNINQTGDLRDDDHADQLNQPKDDAVFEANADVVEQADEPLDLIPGLPRQAQSEDVVPDSDKPSIVEERALDDSPLGELRFQDD